MATSLKSPSWAAREASYRAASVLAPHIVSIENALGGLPFKQRERLGRVLRMNMTQDVRAVMLAVCEDDALVTDEMQKLLHGELGMAIKEMTRDTSSFVDGLGSRFWAKRSTHGLKALSEQLVSSVDGYQAEPIAEPANASVISFDGHREALRATA